MVATELPIVKFFKLSQYKKASLSIAVTELGMSMLVRPVQL